MDEINIDVYDNIENIKEPEKEIDIKNNNINKNSESWKFNSGNENSMASKIAAKKRENEAKEEPKKIKTENTNVTNKIPFSIDNERKPNY